MVTKEAQDTHRKAIGYVLWIFGFTGSHRFYYGYPGWSGQHQGDLGFRLDSWSGDLSGWDCLFPPGLCGPLYGDVHSNSLQAHRSVWCEGEGFWV